MLYITGDTHGGFQRFNTKNFRADGDLVKLRDGPSRLRQLVGDVLHPPGPPP